MFLVAFHFVKQLRTFFWLIFVMVYFLALLCLAFSLLASCTAQPFVLVNYKYYYPRECGCVQTECGPRSGGCNRDTGNCILSEIFGYSHGKFMDIIPESRRSGKMPGVADNSVIVSVGYRNFNSTLPQGILQLWKFSNTKNGVDFFEYGNHEFFLYLAANNITQRFTFLELESGFYRVVFWDYGGTRYGNGVPESSPMFEI